MLWLGILIRLSHRVWPFLLEGFDKVWFWLLHADREIHPHPFWKGPRGISPYYIVYLELHVAFSEWLGWGWALGYIPLSAWNHSSLYQVAGVIKKHTLIHSDTHTVIVEAISQLFQESSKIFAQNPPICSFCFSRNLPSHQLKHEMMIWGDSTASRKFALLTANRGSIHTIPCSSPLGHQE